MINISLNNIGRTTNYFIIIYIIKLYSKDHVFYNVLHIIDSTKKTIQYIEELELKNLNNYLSSKFSFKNSSTLKCNLCNNFIGTNLKSIAAHKRKCKGNKTIDEISSEDISTESLPNDISTDILTDILI